MFIETTKQTVKVLMLSVFLVFLFAQNTNAQTEITQAMIDAAQLKIDQACPVRWQNVSKKLVIPTDASESVWEDTTDRTEFVTYITTVIADSGSTADPQVLTDDVATVAAECATKRTGLFDLLLIKEPNDVILGMRVLKGVLEEQGAFSRDGSSQSLAAKSCKEIKDGYNDSTDGIYWLDFDAGNSDNAVEVHCDMTTDGGGWTFIAFVLGSLPVEINAPSFFDQAYGTYEPARLTKPEHYSLGVLPLMDDTEMIVAYHSPNIAEANSNANMIWFKYNKTSPTFNYGPIPCNKGALKFTLNLDPNGSLGADYDGHFDNGSTGCGPSYFDMRAPFSNNGYPHLFAVGPTNGVFMGYAVLRGSNNGGNVYTDAWFYVR